MNGVAGDAGDAGMPDDHGDSVDPPALPLTGERTVPGIWHENYWFLRQELVYQWVHHRFGRGRVLDAGCGEGYGAQLLSGRAEPVVGIDYDDATIRHVRSSYPAVTVARANLVQLPFADAAFDVVASLQTIEHLWDQPAFVAECARVAAPGGVVIMSTPNRLTFPPGNICHYRELDADEFARLLPPWLRLVELLGLRHGPRLREWEHQHGPLPAAQIATGPDAWPDSLREVVASVTVEDFEIHHGDLVDTLDLIAVAAPR